jgi:hypothetical protein
VRFLNNIQRYHILVSLNQNDQQRSSCSFAVVIIENEILLIDSFDIINNHIDRMMRRKPCSVVPDPSRWIVMWYDTFLLLIFVSSIVANRDDSYEYVNHDGGMIAQTFTNRTMYWHDAQAVLSDLHLFSSLSIQFHSCV